MSWLIHFSVYRVCARTTLTLYECSLPNTSDTEIAVFVLEKHMGQRITNTDKNAPSQDHAVIFKGSVQFLADIDAFEQCIPNRTWLM